VISGVVEEGTCKGEVSSSNPTGREASVRFYVKKYAPVGLPYN